MEFVHFCSDDQAKKVRDRVEYYHCMRMLSFRNAYGMKYLQRLINYFLSFQRKLNLKRRVNRKLPLAYGAQWFSITHDLAQEVLNQERWIKRHFRFTCCSDEHFLQTIVRNTEFKDKLYLKKGSGYLACMRYIDWTRGNPYVFREDDFQDLINSKYLFARKFSLEVDRKIVMDIYHHILKRNQKKNNI